MYGTVRKDRGPPAVLKRASPGEKKLADGESRWRMSNDPLLVCVWRDTTEDGVWFLSTCHQPAVASVLRRKKGHPCKAPSQSPSTATTTWGPATNATRSVTTALASCATTDKGYGHSTLINSHDYFQKLKGKNIPLKRYILEVCKSFASASLAGPVPQTPVQKRSTLTKRSHPLASPMWDPPS